ncbi:MAG: MmgE/PrpD family protein [Synergistota bacterium]|nr:MmgE/PrpD family protein [Synergistota bacterium]
MSINRLAVLAEYTSTFRIKNLPVEVVNAAKICAIDSIGVAVGGVKYEEVPAVINTFLSLSGVAQANASIWGTERSTSVFQAAFLNGLMAHSLELDDVHTESKTHIGAVVLPAVWSVAEAISASGSQVIEAIVAGYETMARIGKGFGVVSHRSKGWHVTGTAGTFGAAAAAAKLLGLDAKKTLYAFGMAGTQSSGLWAFLADGASSKKMHAGRAAENGVVAAFLAQAGMTGPKYVLEAQDGGLYPATSDSYSLEEVSKDLGEIFEILKVNRKPYACCRSMHPAIDAILEIRAEHPDVVDHIKKIQIKSYEVGVKQCGTILYPRNVSEAKFCMRFGAAVAFLDGAAGPKQFSMDRILDPKVEALAKRVKYTADQEFTARYPEKWGCLLEVELDDGALLKKTVFDASGSITNPMTPTQLEAKFVNLVGSVLATQRTDTLLQDLKKLEMLKVVPAITKSMNT